jgi:hypothetical protein
LAADTVLSFTRIVAPMNGVVICAGGVGTGGAGRHVVSSRRRGYALVAMRGRVGNAGCKSAGGQHQNAHRRGPG